MCYPEGDESAADVAWEPVEGYYGEPEEVEGEADAEAVDLGGAGEGAWAGHLLFFYGADDAWGCLFRGPGQVCLHIDRLSIWLDINVDIGVHN